MGDRACLVGVSYTDTVKKPKVREMNIPIRYNARKSKKE
jgi:hypothetical protein